MQNPKTPKPQNPKTPKPLLLNLQIQGVEHAYQQEKDGSNEAQALSVLPVVSPLQLLGTFEEGGRLVSQFFTLLLQDLHRFATIQNSVQIVAHGGCDDMELLLHVVQLVTIGLGCLVEHP